MIVLNGRYNFAKIMLPNDEEKNQDGLDVYKYLDIPTQEQIQSFLNHPAFANTKIVIMPDVHYGKGSCVGFTMQLGKYVIPNIVGVDIGCGIMATKLPKSLITHQMHLEDFDNFVKKNIPAGFNIHQKPVEYYVDELPLYDVCNYLGIGFDRVLNSIGTLGGGNHFIELGRDEEGDLWLTIHSGSRNLGLQVANFFQRRADELCGTYFQDFKDLNFIPHRTTQFADYIEYMNVAQDYAYYNRLTMTRIILDGFFGSPNYLDQIDSVHNYIDFNDNIIRKGATSAQEGQRLVIPFNMQEGLIIATGKGNKDWNYSAPHGAGRILSRNKAKQELKLDDAVIEMNQAGVYTTSLNKDTLDEAKGAYKDKQLILDMIGDTVTVDTFVKPIYNFKAG